MNHQISKFARMYGGFIQKIVKIEGLAHLATGILAAIGLYALFVGDQKGILLAPIAAAAVAIAFFLEKAIAGMAPYFFMTILRRKELSSGTFYRIAVLTGIILIILISISPIVTAIGGSYLAEKSQPIEKDSDQINQDFYYVQNVLS